MLECGSACCEKSEKKIVINTLARDTIFMGQAFERCSESIWLINTIGLCESCAQGYGFVRYG